MPKVACVCVCVCHAMHNYASLVKVDVAAKFLFDVGLEDTHVYILEECNTLLASEREQLNIARVFCAYVENYGMCSAQQSLSHIKNTVTQNIKTTS